jgi:hypothetical protein
MINRISIKFLKPKYYEHESQLSRDVRITLISTASRSCYVSPDKKTLVIERCVPRERRMPTDTEVVHNRAALR